LCRAVQRELAVLNAAGEAAGHLGHGILAIGSDEIGKCCEQRGVGQHLRLDAVTQSLFPRIEDVSQSGLLPSLIVRVLYRMPGRLQQRDLSITMPRPRPKTGTDARQRGDKEN